MADGAPGAQRVEFAILGPLEVRLRGRAAVPSPGSRALLGPLLLTPGETVEEGRLADLLWGPGEVSRGALHTSISRLRSWLRAELGLGEAIERTASGYRIDLPTESVDVARFRSAAGLAVRASDPTTRIEQLRSALDEWRGPVLADAPEWVRTDPIVTSLERARADHARELADAALHAGRPEVALAHLRQVATALPYDEPLQATLITLLGACGRRAEGLRLFEDMRRRLAEELGVGPSDELRKAHLALLRTDHDRAASPTADGPAHGSDNDTEPAAPAPVPAQLPPDTAVFLGRGDELDRLRELVQPAEDGPATLVAINGPGGVGKSALAVHAAHQLTKRFPDGTLYANLQGASPGLDPLEPGEVLARWLRALGAWRNQAAVDLHEATAQFRSLLSGRRVLLVLDGALDERQVAPLLPTSPGCAAILTSRSPLTALDDARSVELDVLEPTQAVQLLGRIAGPHRVADEPDAATETARLCGYLPLALRVCGARLAARPHWRVGELVSRLHGERGRLDQLAHRDLEVRPSLALSLQGLTPRARRLFGLLGLFDVSDFPAWVGAALLDTSPTDAEDLVEELADARLLEVASRDATGRTRYRFHDLTRLYARERAHAEETPQDRRAAFARTAGAGLYLAERANERLASPFVSFRGSAPRFPLPKETVDDLVAYPMAWFETERSGLATVVTQAADLDLGSFAWETTSALGPFLETHADIDTWWCCVEQSLDAAQRAGDLRGQAAMHYSRADLHYFMGRSHEAAACLETALAGFTELGDDHARASCLTHLAITYRDRNELDRSQHTARQALTLLRHTTETRLRPRALLTLGMVYLRQEGLAAAANCFARGLRSYESAGNVAGQADALRWIAHVELDRGEPQRAVDLSLRALTMAERSGYRLMRPLIRHTLGRALLAAGHLNEARAELEHNMEHARGVRVLAPTLRTLGEVLLAQGDHSDAIASLRESLDLWRTLGMPAEEKTTLRALAAAYSAAGRHDDAEQAEAQVHAPSADSLSGPT